MSAKLPIRSSRPYQCEVSIYQGETFTPSLRWSTVEIVGDTKVKTPTDWTDHSGSLVLNFLGGEQVVLSTENAGMELKEDGTMTFFIGDEQTGLLAKGRGDAKLYVTDPENKKKILARGTVEVF